MATGEEIFKWFSEGDVAPLTAAHEIIVALAKEFDTDVQGLNDANESLRSHWEGDAADAAGKGMDPLVEGHEQSIPMIVDASSSVSQQGNQLSDAKNNVVEVPPEPDKPSPWTAAAAVVAPGLAAGEYKSYRDGMAANTEANANNVRVMEQYGAGTQGTRSALPQDYGIVADDGAGIHIGSTSASSVGGLPGSGPSVGTLGPTAGGTSGVGPFGGGPGPVGGPGPAGGGLPSVPPGPGPAPGPTSGPALVGGGPPAGGPPAGRPGGMPIVAPIGGANTPGDETRRGRGTTGANRPPAGQARAGARLAGGAPAAKADPRTILRGAPAAGAKITGGTAGLQAGKGAGVGMPGGSGTQAGARGLAGAGGRGAGGMAPGAAGQRAQGDEDKEHKDKYWVREEFDDGLVTETDELGAKVVDEQTGNTVVNPVIGEPEQPKAAAPVAEAAEAAEAVTGEQKPDA